MSIRVIAAKYRVDPDALRNFAARAGWTRGDLHDAIQTSSQKALIVRTVAEDQDSGDAFGGPVVATAEETVERYGQLSADVGGSHRADVARGRLHASRLEHELYRLVDTLRQRVSDPKEQLALIRSAAETLRCLAMTTKCYVELERLAWGLDKPAEPRATYDDFLAEFYGENVVSGEASERQMCGSLEHRPFRPPMRHSCALGRSCPAIQQENNER